MRRTVAFAAVPLLLLQAGCLAENSLDMAVYFDNKTDETLFLRRRDMPDDSKRRALEPRQVSTVMLVGEGQCIDLWVIKDSSGKLVKDPGRMCWHDTVTIP